MYYSCRACCHVLHCSYHACRLVLSCIIVHIMHVFMHLCRPFRHLCRSYHVLFMFMSCVVCTYRAIYIYIYIYIYMFMSMSCIIMFMSCVECLSHSNAHAFQTEAILCSIFEFVRVRFARGAPSTFAENMSKRLIATPLTHVDAAAWCEKSRKQQRRLHFATTSEAGHRAEVERQTLLLERRLCHLAAVAAGKDRQRKLGAETIVNAYGLTAYYDPDPDIDRLFVKIYDVRKFKRYVCFLDMMFDDTIKTLKAKIQDEEDIPTDDMFIVFRGERLEDHRTLCSYQIGDDCILHAVRTPTEAILDEAAARSQKLHHAIFGCKTTL